MTSKMSTGKKWNVKKGGYRNKKKQSTKKRKPSTRKSSKRKRKPSTRKPSKRKPSKRKPSKRSSVRKNKKTIKKMKGGYIRCADVNVGFDIRFISTFPAILKQNVEGGPILCDKIEDIPTNIEYNSTPIKNYYKKQYGNKYLKYKRIGLTNNPYGTTNTFFKIKDIVKTPRTLDWHYILSTF
jgi:hypothetical protein